jgi:Rrf2 family nitric oxide-sensitive transcriptional repressor
MAFAKMQYLKYLFHMRLNVQTDYALRILMALAEKPDAVQSVDAIAKLHGISRNHLAKVAQDLVRAGFAVSTRGRGGGLRLARPASDIPVSDVVKAIENDLGVVECLQTGSVSVCAYLPRCKLKLALAGAARAFIDHLAVLTLADLLPSKVREP